MLALDIDGVLHPATSGTLAHLERFEAVLRAFPCVGIVISSTWRETMRPEVLVGLFSPDIRERIVGFTPAPPAANRYAEIVAFCRETGVRLWIAIDDRAEEFPRACPELLLTRGDTGLDQDTAATLHARLAALGHQFRVTTVDEREHHV